MSRSKRAMVWTMLVLFLAGTGSFLAAEAAVAQAKKAVSRRLAAALRSAGLEGSNFAFQRAVISLRGGVRFHGVTARLENTSAAEGQKLVAGLNAASVAFLLPDFSLSKVLLQLDDFTLTSAGNTAAAMPQAAFAPAAKRTVLQGKMFSILFPVDSKRPLDSLNALQQNIRDFLFNGGSSAKIEFHGKTFIAGRMGSFALKLNSVQENGLSRLVFSCEDLREFLKQSGEKLTNAEVKLIAENPSRAEKLFAIKERAVTLSKSAAKRDPQVSEDAYRHVVWSYILTKEFGAQFAERVTDAHEEGDIDDSKADHEMDFRNNAVGRKYAADNVDERAILRTMRKDPDVIKAPRRASGSAGGTPAS